MLSDERLRWIANLAHQKSLVRGKQVSYGGPCTDVVWPADEAERTELDMLRMVAAEAHDAALEEAADALLRLPAGIFAGPACEAVASAHIRALKQEPAP